MKIVTTKYKYWLSIEILRYFNCHHTIWPIKHAFCDIKKLSFLLNNFNDCWLSILHVLLHFLTWNKCELPIYDAVTKLIFTILILFFAMCDYIFLALFIDIYCFPSYFLIRQAIQKVVDCIIWYVEYMRKIE